MSEQVKKMTQDRTTEDKMKELFDLMDQKAAEGALNEIEEDRSESAPAGDAAEPGKQEDAPMTTSEAAAYEYSMMMRQYEAMLEDYQRREAEEEAERAKAAAQGE